MRMDIERFSRLVEAYGARPGVWPRGEQRTAQALLHRDATARELLDEARRLDCWLDTWAVPATTAAQQTPAALPPRNPVDRLIAWLLPRAPRELWRPALAAGVTLALGAALGAGLSPWAGPTQWEAQERYLLMATAPGEMR